MPDELNKGAEHTTEEVNFLEALLLNMPQAVRLVPASRELFEVDQFTSTP